MGEGNGVYSIIGKKVSILFLKGGVYWFFLMLLSTVRKTMSQNPKKIFLKVVMENQLNDA